MPRKTDKRIRLIKAAERLIHQQGFNLTTLADIAQRADVPLGNVYYDFGDTDEAGSADPVKAYQLLTKTAKDTEEAYRLLPKISEDAELFKSTNLAIAHLLNEPRNYQAIFGVGKQNKPTTGESLSEGDGDKKEVKEAAETSSLEQERQKLVIKHLLLARGCEGSQRMLERVARDYVYGKNSLKALDNPCNNIKVGDSVETVLGMFDSLKEKNTIHGKERKCKQEERQIMSSSSMSSSSSSATMASSTSSQASEQASSVLLFSMQTGSRVGIAPTSISEGQATLGSVIRSQNKPDLRKGKPITP